MYIMCAYMCMSACMNVYVSVAYACVYVYMWRPEVSLFTLSFEIRSPMEPGAH